MAATIARPLEETPPPKTAPTAKFNAGIDAKEIRDRFERGAGDLRLQHKNFWTNRAFVRGEQWVSWNSLASRLELVAREGGRVRQTINRMRPASRRIMAKLLRRPLVFDVSPRAADDASVIGARIGQAVLAHTANEQAWETLRRAHAWAAWLGGTGGICVEWDPAAATSLGQDPETGRNVGTGDVIVSSLTITEMVTQPGAADIEKAHWWIKVAALPPEEVQERYGMATAPPADASAAMSPSDQNLRSTDTKHKNELTQVLTLFERPHGKQKGREVVVVDQAVVDEGPWSFPFTDHLNLVVAREMPVDGLWAGDTVLSDAVSSQAGVNQSWSSIVEHAKASGNARLAIPEGSVEDVQEFTDDPSDSFEYTPIGGQKPEWMAPANLPTWMLELPNRFAAEIDDALGDHDVSRGDAPGGADSGVAINLLIEQDDTPLGAFSKELAECWGRAASMVLDLYAVKVQDTRKARVTMPDQSIPESVEWSGKSLAGQTTATVPLEAVAPRSRAAQYQVAMNLAAAFPGQIDFATFARLADLPGRDEVLTSTDPDSAKAQRENHSMAIGNAAVPAVFDNHDTHIKVHNRFRKSDRYEQMSEQDRAMVDEHCKAHEVYAAEEMGTQLAKGLESPALAAAAQAHEPPLAGTDPSTLPPPAMPPSGGLPSTVGPMAADQPAQPAPPPVLG